MRKPSTPKPVRIAPEDAALFRAAVGAVQPVTGQDRLPHTARRKPVFRAPTTAPAPPDALSDFAPDSTPDEYLGNGISRMTLRKLKRTLPIEDSLDLHGNNSDAARKLLQAFLHEAGQRKLRCVLVIHGKGLNSRDGEAVLRKRVRHWLVQHPLVLGYCNATPGTGGSGAVLVLLKNAA